MSTTTAPYTPTFLNEASIPKFSVARYDRMVNDGYLTSEDKVELLENYVVLKMPRNPVHDGTIQLTSKKLLRLLPTGWDIRCQLTVALSDSRPEPDLAIVKGDERTYLSAHPTPTDVGLIVEVANTSVIRDQRDKARIYARGNVVCYWIVNLDDRRIEVHTQPSGPCDSPTYTSVVNYAVGDTVPLVLDGVAVANIPVCRFAALKLLFRSQDPLDMSPVMGQVPRAKSSRLRRAVAGSVVAHLLLVSLASVAIRERGTNPNAPSQAKLDTRADEPVLRMLPDEITVTVPTPTPEPTRPEPEPVQPTEPPTPEPPTAPVVTQPQPQPAPVTATTRPPLKNIVPNTLPAQVTALIHRPTPTPVTARIVDPNVKPASAATPATPTTPAIHGAMKAGQTVVYVLDCSGSMGEFGKLTLARLALVSTLRRQSPDVKFQVLAYNSAAHAVLPGSCVAATVENIAAAEGGLAKLKATGRSNHVEAVRAAAALRPDVILLLTDAEELSAASFKAVLAGVGKPLPVCLARVTAEGVTAPRELK